MIDHVPILSVQKHVDVYTCWFSKCGECSAPWVIVAKFCFCSRTLNPLPLPPCCPSLQRDSSPPLLILSGYHSDAGEKSPGCRLRFEFSHCRNVVGAQHGQGRVSTVRYLKNYQWGKNLFRFEKKKQSCVTSSSARGRKGSTTEMNEMQKKKEWAFLLSACGQRANAVWQMLLYLYLNVASLDLKWNLKCYSAGVLH